MFTHADPQRWQGGNATAVNLRATRIRLRLGASCFAIRVRSKPGVNRSRNILKYETHLRHGTANEWSESALGIRMRCGSMNLRNNNPIREGRCTCSCQWCNKCMKVYSIKLSSSSKSFSHFSALNASSMRSTSKTWG